jgi:hypothetical protein
VRLLFGRERFTAELAWTVRLLFGREWFTAELAWTDLTAGL